MLNNNNQWNRIGSWLSFCVMAVLLSACSEVSDSLSDGTSPSASSKDAVAFSATVSSIKQATRADATIVNKGETKLLPTATSKRKVGIFGCYTGPYTWAELVALAAKANKAETLVALSEKVSKQTFDNAMALKADSDYVNTMLREKVNFSEYNLEIQLLQDQIDELKRIISGGTANP